MDYSQFLKQELTKAGKLAQSYLGKVSDTIKSGDSNQILTEADLAVGKQLIAAVQKHFPSTMLSTKKPALSTTTRATPG